MPATTVTSPPEALMTPSLTVPTPLSPEQSSGSGRPTRRGEREHLLAAAGEIARALLAEQPRREVLQLIAGLARQGTSALLALVGTSTEGELLRVDAAAGPDGDRVAGRSIGLRAIADRVLVPGPDGTSSRADPGHRSDLTVSLGATPAGERRLLVVLGLPAARRAAAIRSLRVFADHTATALTLDDERVAAEQERLLQDRDRTASGLSELVVPLLFSAGLRLAGADGLLHDRSAQVRARLRAAADDLDEALVQVRTVALGPIPERAGGDHGRLEAEVPGPDVLGPDVVGPDVLGLDVRRPDVLAADLQRALSAGDDDVTASLRTVLATARASCPSCVAVSLGLDHDGRPTTVTATADPGCTHAASMAIRCATPDGVQTGSPVLLVFGTDGPALARLAADVAQLGTHRGRVTLGAPARIPPPSSADPVGTGQVADRTTVDRALGALLEQGWAPDEGRQELQRRADSSGAPLVRAAAVVLATLPGTPVRRRRPRGRPGVPPPSGHP